MIKGKNVREVGHLLLEVKCLRLGTLTSASGIKDDELQMLGNLEYYFVLRQITNLILSTSFY